MPPFGAWTGANPATLTVNVAAVPVFGMVASAPVATTPPFEFVTFHLAEAAVFGDCGAVVVQRNSSGSRDEIVLLDFQSRGMSGPGCSPTPSVIVMRVSRRRPFFLERSRSAPGDNEPIGILILRPTGGTRPGRPWCGSERM